MTPNNTSNNPSTRTVLIDLDDSRYARSFTGDRQLHQPELEQAMNLIREQLDSINDRQPSHSTSNYLEHRYRTIGVFGDRGSGKTSFLISLLEECGGLKGVEILPVIDPTLVEHKKPIVLSVLSMIHSRVKCRLDGLECSPTSDACLKRRAWEEAVRQVAEGVMAIMRSGSASWRATACAAFAMWKGDSRRRTRGKRTTSTSAASTTASFAWSAYSDCKAFPLPPFR